MTKIKAICALALCAAALSSSSCTTFNNARPLKPGEHAASLTLGGPVTAVPGVGTIPLPNATLEGRHGVVHQLDVNYGLHLLPTLFGAAGGHVGATWQLYDEPEPWFPVLSAGQRFFFFTNIFDARTEKKDAYALSQTDLTLSWSIYESLIYTGVSLYLPVDVDDRAVHFAPVAGVEIHPGLDWLRVQLEGRWLSPSTDTRFAVVNWQGPNDMGAIAINLGVAIEFSALFADNDTPPQRDDSVNDAESDAAESNATAVEGAQP
jgi:hypothetical protein